MRLTWLNKNILRRCYAHGCIISVRNIDTCFVQIGYIELHQLVDSRASERDKTLLNNITLDFNTLPRIAQLGVADFPAVFFMQELNRCIGNVQIRYGRIKMVCTGLTCAPVAFATNSCYQSSFKTSKLPIWISGREKLICKNLDFSSICSFEEEVCTSCGCISWIFHGQIHIMSFLYYPGICNGHGFEKYICCYVDWISRIWGKLGLPHAQIMMHNRQLTSKKHER